MYCLKLHFSFAIPFTNKNDVKCLHIQSKMAVGWKNFVVSISNSGGVLWHVLPQLWFLENEKLSWTIDRANFSQVYPYKKKDQSLLPDAYKGDFISKMTKLFSDGIPCSLCKTSANTFSPNEMNFTIVILNHLPVCGISKCKRTKHNKTVHGGTLFNVMCGVWD